MKLFKISNLIDIKKDNKKRVVALGFFDGIHLAHQEIILKSIKKSKEKNQISTLITFNISPKEYFVKEKIKLITPLKEKFKILSDLGVEELYILEFNEQIRNSTKEDFIDKVLLKLNVEEVYCGYDYLFGYKGEGTPEYIEKYGKIKANVLNKMTIDNTKVSSTNLRNLIEIGDFDNYRKFTNRNYKISGNVVRGKQLGRTINFPTANLLLNDDYILPENLGVYITKVNYKNNNYIGITNIGKNPTVSDLGNITIETHILDFDYEIYGEEISLDFFKYIRSEQKFSGIEDLKKQLILDKKEAENYFKNNKNLLKNF